MRVLLVHNRYVERGGEDRVVELERRLLEQHGHEVIPYELDNHAVAGMHPILLAGRTVWSRSAHAGVGALIAQRRPEVMHVHNTLPLASPSVYYAARAAGVPVVQTLHNYRLICPNALCLRDGRPCTACVGRRVPTPAIRHACYRGSRTATAAVTAMLAVHRAAGTWSNAVHTYIAPTSFARRLLASGGLPEDRIVVKPHFVDPDPGVGPGNGGYAVYVGRLSREKGLDTLLAAWAALDGRVPLHIVGDGPLAPQVAAAAATVPGITWLGRREPAEVARIIGNAAVLVFPSIAYETFGQVVIEAYAAGTPVIVTGSGAAAEMVDPGRTGLLVRPGDPADLAEQTRTLFADPGTLRAMRAPARAAYESQFTAAAAHAHLSAIYQEARR